MAEAISMLRREQRRHLLMNGWLIAGFVIVGTAVTNERGIFRPLDFGAFAANARAFVAIAQPASLPNRLRDVRSVSALDPFDVTGPSRDLRRRLADAMDWMPGDPAAQQEPLAMSSIPDSIAMNNVPAAPASAGPAAFASPPQQLGFAPASVPPEQTTSATTPPTDGSTTPGDGTTPGGGTTPGDGVTSPVGVVPEPATWAMMIAGFGLVGGLLRFAGIAHRRAARPLVRRRKGQRPAAFA